MGNLIEEKIIDGNGALLKLEVYRSGKTIDGRSVSRADVREIYNHTKQFILSQNVTIPLKFGHDDSDQTIKGEVLDIEIKRKRKKKTLGYELSLIARIHFRGRAYELFKAGELPNVSAEIAPSGFTEDGEEHGQYLMGLALLGTDVPAIPWLQTQFQHDDSIYYYSYQPGRNLHFQTEKPMEPEMFQIPEEFLTAVEMLNEAVTTINELINAEPAEEPAEEAATDGEESKADTASEDFDKDARIKELESLLADKESESKIESSFAKLHSAGKVKQDDKPIFTALVKAEGVEKALEMYSTRATIKTPPLTTIAKPKAQLNGKQSEGWEQFKAQWAEHYTKTLPLRDKSNKERFEKLVEYSAKNQYAQINGGH